MQLVFVGFPPTKTGQKEKQTLQNRMMAVSKTIRSAGLELSDPKRMNSSQKKRFVKWFGQKTTSDNNFDYDPVTNKVSKLSHGFSNATVNVYRYTGLPGLGCPVDFCDDTLAAAVTPQNPTFRHAETGGAGGHKLIVCPDFWHAPIMGRTYSPDDTQLGTLMHEMTHMFAGTDDKGSDGTDATAYGEANCLNNAMHAVDRARMNADNYMYYLTELYFQGYQMIRSSEKGQD